MSKAVVLLFLLVGVAGCATPPPPSIYGNFVENQTAANEKIMVTDVINQLVALYPPASTLFTLEQPTPDVFGSSLVETVRAKGYALLEFKPYSAPSPNTTVSPGLPLRYVLDQATGTNIYRVTLLIGPQTLTRAYVAQAGTVYPAGNWVRKE